MKKYHLIVSKSNGVRLKILLDHFYQVINNEIPKFFNDLSEQRTLHKIFTFHFILVWKSNIRITILCKGSYKNCLFAFFTFFFKTRVNKRRKTTVSFFLAPSKLLRTKILICQFHCQVNFTCSLSQVNMVTNSTLRPRSPHPTPHPPTPLTPLTTSYTLLHQRSLVQSQSLPKSSTVL